MIVYNYESNLLEKMKDVGDLLSGSYYTPIKIAFDIVEKLRPSIKERIIEPSCGSGVFVFSIIKYISEEYSLEPKQLKLWFIDKLVAVDIKIETIVDLRLNLAKYFTGLGVHSEPEDFSNVFVADGLSISGSYDIAIGNPPYINSRNLELRKLKLIRSNYESCKSGRADIYLAFTEHYMKIAKRVSFIIPMSFTRNKLSDVFKEKYRNKIKWVQFYDNSIFDNANIYTMSFEFDTLYSSEDVLVVNDGVVSHLEFSKVFTNFKELLDSDLIIGGDLATLSNKLYKVSKVNNRFYSTNDIGEPFEIESGIVKIAFKCTKIEVIDCEPVINDDDYIIFPYFDDNNPMPEDYLVENYPLAYKYLFSIKEKLHSRDKGKASLIIPFYAYGRKQGLSRRNGHYYIVFPKIIGGENCYQKVISTESIKRTGMDFFVFSGYTLEIDDPKDIVLFEGFYDYISSFCQPYSGSKKDFYSISPRIIKSYLEEISI